MPATPRNVVCLVVDRLRAAALGAYGSTWGETPEIDALAVDSLVLDFALADHPTLAGFYRAAWQGRHALPGPLGVGSGSQADLPTLLAAAEVRGVLLSDEPDFGQIDLAEAFEETLLPSDEDAEDYLNEPKSPARSLEETGLARLTATAIVQLEELAAERDPFCLWIHSRGLGGPWDAPLELRNRLVDEDDPLPPQGTEVPRRRLAKDHDPDEIFGASCAYQGQVSLVDMCVGLLVDQLAACGLDESTLLVLIGARGFPLGEHGRLGPADTALGNESLFGETLHIPWLMRYPRQASLLTRSPLLVQPADLYASITAWLGLPAPPNPYWAKDLAGCIDDSRPEGLGEIVRDRICLEVEGERAIRTPHWFLRKPVGGPAQLFAKPDDRFEVNDVANRCRPVVEGLAAAWEDFARFAAGEIDTLPPLDEELTVAPG